MTVIRTYTTTDPRDCALRFSAIMAADKGIPSDLLQTETGWLVVFEDGRAVQFRWEEAENILPSAVNSL